MDKLNKTEKSELNELQGVHDKISTNSSLRATAATFVGGAAVGLGIAGAAKLLGLDPSLAGTCLGSLFLGGYCLYHQRDIGRMEADEEVVRRCKSPKLKKALANEMGVRLRTRDLGRTLDKDSMG